MITPHHDSWEERFDKEFPRGRFCCGGDFCAGSDDHDENKELKSFIRSLLAKDWSMEEYKKSYDRGYKIGGFDTLSTYKSELRKKLEEIRKYEKDVSIVYFNPALDAAINLLDN